MRMVITALWRKHSTYSSTKFRLRLNQKDLKHWLETLCKQCQVKTTLLITNAYRSNYLTTESGRSYLSTIDIVGCKCHGNNLNYDSVWALNAYPWASGNDSDRFDICGNDYLPWKYQVQKSNVMSNRCRTRRWNYHVSNEATNV